MKLGTLYIVGTPIGNLDDFTKRAIETLNKVDYVLAEDTKKALNLFSHFNINNKLESYYKEVEVKKLDKIIKDLKSGKNIALISDAGMPAISDPGAILVKRAKEENILISGIPGPSAGILLYSMSGFLSNQFIFYGFLKKSKNELKEIKYNKYPTIIYESPKRIKNTLEIVNELMPKRQLVVGRELTKKFETVYYGTARDIINQVIEKGEFILIINGEENFDFKSKEISLKEHYLYYESKGLKKKEIQKAIAKDLNLKKNEVYKKLLNEKSNDD